MTAGFENAVTGSPKTCLALANGPVCAHQTEAHAALACTLEVPFAHLPPENKARAFGLEYASLQLPDGGQLFVTPYGWTLRHYLLPQQWYTHKRFHRVGERQQDGVGTVYKVPVSPAGARPKFLVVKFSRFAQSSLVYMGSYLPRGLSPGALADAYLNSPFEEFGLLVALRKTQVRAKSQVRTKRPLAIYSPPDIIDSRLLGRSESRFASCVARLERDQDSNGGAVRIRLDICRQYILLYEWVKGENAKTLCRQGALPLDELQQLVASTNDDLRAAGFRILDNKPEHIILRRRKRDGSLLRRQGRLVYALVDFELLKQL